MLEAKFWLLDRINHSLTLDGAIQHLILTLSHPITEQVLPPACDAFQKQLCPAANAQSSSLYECLLKERETVQ